MYKVCINVATMLPSISCFLCVCLSACYIPASACWHRSQEFTVHDPSCLASGKVNPSQPHPITMLLLGFFTYWLHKNATWLSVKQATAYVNHMVGLAIIVLKLGPKFERFHGTRKCWYHSTVAFLLFPVRFSKFSKLLLSTYMIMLDIQ